MESFTLRRVFEYLHRWLFKKFHFFTANVPKYQFSVSLISPEKSQSVDL